MKTGEDRIATLRPALFEAGYTLPAVQRVLGADRLLSSREEELIIFERRLAGDSALSLAGRLLLLNRDVDRAAWDRALPGLPAESLVEMGLASATGGVLTASVRLVPHGDVYIASDRVDEAKDPEHVTGINNPAVLLSDLAVRRRVGLGLDLGCGGGIQSLLMSRHCERVIATDLNPRALEFTQLNAQINGVTNIETRLGSFFEPVEGLAFDLILCNPPYVISPESQFLYRDSGMPADSLCRQLVGEVGLHLAEGGYGQLLVSWVQPEQRPWAAVLEEWLGDAPCDAWFLHYSTEDPLSNAAKWNRPLRFAELAGFGEAVDRWSAYFRENSIDAIGFGSVTLRRRSNAVTWRRADELREGHNSASDHIQRVFAAEDLLRGLDDDDGIMETRCRLAPGHRLEQTMVEGPDGGWQPLQTRLVMTEGLGFQGSLDLPLAQVLQHLDGRRTLAEAVTVAAAEMGSPAPRWSNSGRPRRPPCGGCSSSASWNRNRPRSNRLGTCVIKVYATTWCGDCRMARHVLDSRSIAYEYIDIDLAPEAAELVQRINGGFRTVPTILFPDGRVLVEPTRIELEEALAA